MARSISGGVVNVKGNSIVDAIDRNTILTKIEKTLTTEELKKLNLMCSDKGRKTLKNKWPLIKNFL